MAGDGAIFRVTNTGDNESNVTSANKIEFNGGATPSGNTNASELRTHMVEDIAFQPNPNRHLDQLQDNKLGTWEYTVSGWIKDTSGSVPETVNFINWMKEDKDNADFEFGRFGYRNDNNSDYDITPISSAGLFLHDVETWQPDNDPEIVMFIAKFYKNGTA